MRHFLLYSLAVVLGLGMTLGACATGGTYARRDMVDDDERGDTNGRSFDFVSSKPEGDEWTIRIRGSSMWAAYSTAEKGDDLGSFNLTALELKDVWDAIDDLELSERKRGLEDKNEGTVTLRLREPGMGEHDIYLVYVSRATEDESVLDLGDVLADIIKSHRGERPSF